MAMRPRRRPTWIRLAKMPCFSPVVVLLLSPSGLDANCCRHRYQALVGKVNLDARLRALIFQVLRDFKALCLFTKQDPAFVFPRRVSSFKPKRSPCHTRMRGAACDKASTRRCLVGASWQGFLPGRSTCGTDSGGAFTSRTARRASCIRGPDHRTR